MRRFFVVFDAIKGFSGEWELTQDELLGRLRDATPEQIETIKSMPEQCGAVWPVDNGTLTIGRISDIE